MSFVTWLLFGAVNGVLLYWIKPDRSAGGYLGAAILGSGGALLGGTFAMVLYQTLQGLNIVFLVVMLMMLAGIFLLISNMFLHRKQFS